MTPTLINSALYTDFYELTMAQGFYLSGKANIRVCFDYFFRENPYQGGYVVFAGLSDLLASLENFRFDDAEIDYLRGQGLNIDFLKYLRDFHFTGDIFSAREGEIVFPYEPILRIEGTIVEAQIIETVVLNILNFESLIATKASRIRLAAGERRVVDFGLRRAQGLGGIMASKAAVIGGVDATSNVFAAYSYDLPLSGTQAHSWIQSFDDELTAFRKYAELYPERCILLVDTYNTLKSGLPNAIVVAKELETRGSRLIAIRLDSGDLAYLSKKARAMLDAAELPYVKIAASNQLDEYVIRSLIDQSAPIDIFGVGTNLSTGKGASALEGVYKLCLYDNKPQLKISDNFAKITLPGKKTVIRYVNGAGSFYADGILLTDEKQLDVIHHPFFPEQKSSVKEFIPEPLQTQVMSNTKIMMQEFSVAASASYARQRLGALQIEHKRFENPHVYKVGISSALQRLRTKLYNEFQKK
jgi:nicotinate phosphoribosyltransferase